MTLIDVHTEVFNEVYLPHLDNMARVQIYYGGSASGKSVFLAQRVVFDLLDGEAQLPHRAASRANVARIRVQRNKQNHQRVGRLTFWT